MPPVGYPSRGPWLFHNETRDFDFWPVLDSINITQNHPDELLTASWQVVDEDQEYVFANEDVVYATFDGERIAAFIISVPGEDQVSQVGPRLWDITGEDFTSKLDDALVRRRTKRKREKVRRRIRWLLSWLRPSIWTLDGRDIDVPDTYIEAYEYYDLTVREALQQVADELRLHFYIDLDNVFHMFRTESFDAPFDLDNEAPNYSTTFPFDTWTHRPDSVELHNAIHVSPEKKDEARWSTSPASIVAYGRQEHAIQDSNLDKPQQAINVGERALNQFDSPVEESTCRVLEPGLWAGMRVHVREVLWDHDFDRVVKSVTIKGVDPHDEEGEAYLFCDVTLVERKPTRMRSGGTRHRPGQTAQTDPEVHDDFDTDVAPPTIVEDVAFTTFAQPMTVSKGMDKDETTEIGPTIDTNPVLKMAGSHLAYPGQYIPPNHFRGWWEGETWYKVTSVPTHPGSAAGVRVAVGGAFAVSGYAGYSGVKFELMVSSTEPTDTRQGVVVGSFPPDGSYVDLDIPIGQVPAAGSSIWIGIRSQWQANYGEEAFAWNWPWMSSASQLDEGGVFFMGRSGRAQFPTTLSATWLVYSGSAASLPPSATPNDAPFEGGWEYEDAGTEGGPVYGVTNGALYLTSTAAAGKGFLQKGEYENEDAPEAPWSDVRWGMEIEFSVTAEGDTGEAGERHIEIATTGQGERTIGYVQLGDGFYDAGIRVTGAGTEDYDASTISANTRYKALFDSRTEVYIAGKIWNAKNRIPANWNVRAAMAETEDDLDRWSIWLRGGNITGAQTIKIHRTRYYPSARHGDRVWREMVGRADGLTKKFYVAHRFRRNRIWLIVNGTQIRPVKQDPDEAWAELDFWPTPGSVIRANYTAD